MTERMPGRDLSVTPWTYVAHGGRDGQIEPVTAFKNLLLERTDVDLDGGLYTHVEAGNIQLGPIAQRGTDIHQPDGLRLVLLTYRSLHPKGVERSQRLVDAPAVGRPWRGWQ